MCRHGENGLNDVAAQTPAGTAKALVLMSGGLDSQLAVCVLRDQGVEVHAVTFESPFFDGATARKACEQLGVPLLVVDFTSEIIAILKNPKHGFGSNMNPCIDCHAMMIKTAGEIMMKEGYDVIATGEVLYERPLSQSRKALDIVAEDSGCSSRLLRPLSAKLLPETEAERSGLIKRDKLLALSGRKREMQFRLAERFGLRDYPTPAGGCRLTDPNYTKRLRDLVDHEGLESVRQVLVLRTGRHFRLDARIKFVLGRNESENLLLEKMAGPSDLVLKAEDVPGPVGLLPVEAREEHILKAAALCAGYSDRIGDQPVRVLVTSPGGDRHIEALPPPEEEVVRLRV